VLAIDADPEMIVAAKEKARSFGGGNIRWLVSRAEDVDLSETRWDLITAGASFHWMDRAVMAQRCYRALRGNGAIAVLGTSSAPWEPTEPWHEVAVAVIRSWLGDRRRAGSQLYAVSQKHEDFLIPAGFRLEHLKFVVEQTWTPVTYLGFLYSTSYAGINVVGDSREGFERDMREALLRCSPDGILKETIPFYAIIGTKS
jgi:ubiquinone/menaquinone biosynthesis C-methylase UbiE